MAVQLGEKVQLVYNVEQLKPSVAFYQKLGFQLLDAPSADKDWALLTDEAILLLLNQNEQEFTGLSYMSADMPDRVAALEQEGVHFDQSQKSEDGLIQATCFDPNQIGISLVRFNPSGIPEVDLNRDTRCGIFGEFFIPTDAFEESAEFWRTIGYKSLFTAEDPYPHGIFSDGRMIVGLHERDDFEKPALSYFAPDMPQRIRSLKLEGIEFDQEFTDEQGNLRNAVLSTPAGGAIFLFEGDFNRQ